MRFEPGDAQALPLADRAVDVAVSGLALNFVPDPPRAVREMERVVRPGGTVALYLWDYAGEMQLMRRFWDAAVALDPEAGALDEGVRFPLCRPEALAALLQEAGLAAVEGRPIDVATVFRDFDDYWTPFLGGQGPAPGYCIGLAEQRRTALRERLRATLPVDARRSHLADRARLGGARQRARVSALMLRLAIPILQLASAVRAETFTCEQVGFGRRFAYRVDPARHDPC